MKDNGGSRRFAAFISYAHSDAAIAAKLQSKLERYRLPKRLAEARAGGQAALGQIFRDRDDLAAAPSLSDAIRAAINEAEALVVICSPDAQASRWVGEEIALFRALHPDRPILAALVRGAPEESFPAALTEGDGEALGFLKIVAGIAGVPLDALVQRDAQRRIRRVMWITGGALAAVLIMGIMTTLALQARNEAARQRAEAEGLVEYMLTDLRDKLKGVGRLDVMEGVNSRAMAYYGDDSIKGRLLDAQVLHAMGEDFDKQAKPLDAEVNFIEAHRQTEALFKKYPQNADVVFAHAQSKYWIGYVHYLKKDYRRAETFWSNYQKQADHLAALPGEKLRGAMEAGYANNNLCVLAVDSKGGAGDPITKCSNAVDAQRAIAMLDAKNPAAKLSLANSIAWLADAREAVEDNAGAMALRREQLAILQKLADADPRNKDYAEFRLTTMTAIARLERKSGRNASALAQLNTARKLGIELISHDPQNATWAGHLRRIEKELANIQRGIKS
jgi:hypothetical protein